jgi:hypothetical protein
MSSKGEILYARSLRRGILAIVVLGTIVWWSSAGAFAQDAPPAGLGIAGHSTSWSFEGPEPGKTPYLVIGMAYRWDTPRYISFPIAGSEATDSSADALTQHVRPDSPLSNTQKIDSAPLVLSSLSNLQTEPTGPRRTTQRSRDLADPQVYSLLSDTSVPRSFLYGYPANYLPQTEWIADNEFPTHEIEQAPKPLLQLEFGGWNFPVLLLSGAVVSQ